jgi:hypothetical protein
VVALGGPQSNATGVSYTRIYNSSSPGRRAR